MKFQLEEGDGGPRILVAGEITEGSDFSPVLDIAGEIVVVDFGGVTRINSFGVREWLNFVSALEKARRKLVLERCAPVIVTQLNTIHNFTGGGEVRSVFGPFYCQECDREDHHLIDLSSGPAKIPDVLPCPGCGKSMEFEELPDEYLDFYDGAA